VEYDAPVIPEVISAALVVLAGALPPPPETVVRTTASFGTVTLDHRAHLARRISCRSCHGDGPIRKIEFTPRSAHATCRNCHVELGRGPTDCRACHVVTPRDPAPRKVDADQAVALAAALPAPPQPTGAPAPSGPMASAPDARTAPVPGDPGLDSGGELPLSRTVELGWLALSGERQGLVAGPSVQLTARTGPTVVAYGLAMPGGRGGRTQVLVGGGHSFSPAPRYRVTALAVGGLDATNSMVSFLPAVGVRAGVELVGRSPWSVGLSATGLVDVRQRDATGERTGGVTFSMGIAAGYRFSR
jgi:hypothetical protein